MTIKDQIIALRKDLNLYNHHYYILDDPIVSDYEFDMKLKQLEKLEENHPEYKDDNSPTLTAWIQIRVIFFLFGGSCGQ